MTLTKSPWFTAIDPKIYLGGSTPLGYLIIRNILDYEDSFKILTIIANNWGASELGQMDQGLLKNRLFYIKVNGKTSFETPGQSKDHS